MVKEWGYPTNIGIMICNCPSGVHNMVFFGYRECGKNGEPKVVIVDQKHNYKITFLANNFEEFIRGFVHEDAFDKMTEKKYEAKYKVLIINYLERDANEENHSEEIHELILAWNFDNPCQILKWIVDSQKLTRLLLYCFIGLWNMACQENFWIETKFSKNVVGFCMILIS